jgi:large subunit ribosomal protein L19
MTETQTTKINKNSISPNLVKLVEAKHFKKHLISGEESELQIGDIIKIGYLIPEGTKDRTQFYEGLVISKQNRGISQSFTLRRTVQGIGVEQVFVKNSPKIVSITRKQSSKVRRAKLYYLRALSGKATRLKAKL